MVLPQIFYSSFWVSAIAIVWFYTDWFIHYTLLLNIFEKTRLEYSSYIKENPDKYFPDFLHFKSFEYTNRFVKFAFKLVSCPFCFLVWLSVGAALICNNIKLAAPIYVMSLFATLQIRKLTYTH